MMIRNKCSLAVIERLVKGNDGHIRTDHIQTRARRTNCPITRIYSLEVTVHETPECASTRMENATSDCEWSKDKPDTSARPRRGTAVRVCQAVAQLAAKQLCPPSPTGSVKK